MLMSLMLTLPPGEQATASPVKLTCCQSSIALIPPLLRAPFPVARSQLPFAAFSAGEAAPHSFTIVNG